jgi:8-oxo-dGTP pyrophosphatase MutT (NUDIX family)
MNSELRFDCANPDPKEWDPIYFAMPRKPSAVAVVLFDRGTSAPQVLLIRRSTKLRSHRGQIGFPGGRIEEGDKSPQDTALREAFEEVGLDRQSVKVLGGVEPIPALDGSLVYPVVVETTCSLEDLKVNQTEVESVHLVPLEKLTANNQKKFVFNLFGCRRHSFLYDCGVLSIWGLSAEILARANFKLVS